MSMDTEMRDLRPTTAGHDMWAAGTDTNWDVLKARKDGRSWADRGDTCSWGQEETSRKRRSTRNSPHCTPPAPNTTPINQTATVIRCSKLIGPRCC